MAYVYVANCTLQHREFPYRVVEAAAYRTLRIPAGSQAKFPEDFTDQQLQKLEEQLVRAGGVPVNDLDALTSAYGLLYKVDRKPITSDQISVALEKDIDKRQEIADTKTEAAGLALLETAEGRGTPNHRPGTVRETSAEIVQLNDNDREEPTKGGVDAKVTVSRKTGQQITRDQTTVDRLTADGKVDGRTRAGRAQRGR